jgi:hypothetical protein
MHAYLASRIMARTTLNIATPVLRELKRLRKKEGRPLGDLASELLAEALALRAKGKPAAPPFKWVSKDMKALVDISDKEAVYSILDQARK